MLGGYSYGCEVITILEKKKQSKTDVISFKTYQFSSSPDNNIKVYKLVYMYWSMSVCVCVCVWLDVYV